MPRRVPLHPSLRQVPFAIADAKALGHSRWRLDSRELSRPFHGVRALGSHAPTLQYAPRLRAGDRFSHTTAAELWGAPLPRALEGHIHVTAARVHQRPRSRGVSGHRSGAGVTAERNGLPVSDPATLFVELASMLRLDDLIAVGDHLVLDPRVLDPADLRPYLSLDKLRATAAGYRGRGARLARLAAAKVREGVESRRETQLRLLLASAGLPEPVCGFEVLDATGRRVGWFDLAWPEWKVIAEYDGDQHRTTTWQYERDISRYDRASDAGWRDIRVRKHGIEVDRTGTIERVRSALVARGWRG